MVRNLGAEPKSRAGAGSDIRVSERSRLVSRSEAVHASSRRDSDQWGFITACKFDIGLGLGLEYRQLNRDMDPVRL